MTPAGARTRTVVVSCVFQIVTLLRALLIVGVLVGVPTVRAACNLATPISNGDSNYEKQPRFTWEAVSPAEEYRLQVRARVPEGRVLASYDLIVRDTVFRSPRPLAEHKVKAVVRLHPICGGNAGAESVAEFVIDTSAACELGSISARAIDGTATVGWRAVPGASRYLVRAHALVDGHLIASQDTRAVRTRIAVGESGAVVSVRPACESGLGEAVYRVVVR